MRAAMDTLLLRLTALQAMVMQKPIITGRYSESPYINFAKPIEVLTLVTTAASRLTPEHSSWPSLFLVAAAEALHETCTGADELM
jgi:hypothetical protein